MRGKLFISSGVTYLCVEMSRIKQSSQADFYRSIYQLWKLQYPDKQIYSITESESYIKGVPVFV